MADDKKSGGMSQLSEQVQASQAWSSIFRPGSIFRKGYSDSPRNRSYVIMNSVLYHLHPVKVKRHAVKVSYTLCLGGLSFFLFIHLTVTGIFLMFFYRPTAAQAWNDIQTLQTAVGFGLPLSRQLGGHSRDQLGPDGPRVLAAALDGLSPHAIAVVQQRLPIA